MKKIRHTLGVGLVASALLVGGLFLTSFVASADPPDNCNGLSINDHRATDGDDFLSGSPDVDVIALSTGGDQYFSGDGGDTLCGNEGSDVLGGEDGPDNLYGGDGPDLLAGLQGADTLNGGDGQDEVNGGGGPDAIRGGPGDGVADDLYDGTGVDTITGGPQDTWHRCDDGDPDDRSAFAGDIVPDPNC